MIKRSFYFIRHGQTHWNKEGRLQGRTNTDLNEKGRQQARESIVHLKDLGIERIVTSPLQRALDTALIINEALQVPLTTDADLQERSFGIFEGMTSDAIQRFKEDKGLLKEALEATGYACPPEAESHDALTERSIAAVNRALDGHNEAVLFVSHGGVFAALAYLLINDGVYRHSDNSVPYAFQYTKNAPWRVVNIREGKESYRNDEQINKVASGLA